MEYLETPGRAGLVISGPRADLVISLDSFTVIGLVGGAPAQGWGDRQLPSVLQAALSAS